MNSRTSVRSRVAAVAALALAAIVVPIGPADAGVAVKQCGTVITGSGASSLDRQLVQCPGDGVVITASNVTFDLRGRSIDGTRGFGSAGVRVKGRNVVVLNGLVRGFREGVVVEPGGQLDAQRMSIWSNDTGVSTRAGSSGSRIYLSTFKDNPFGVLLRGNAHTVDRSYFDVIHSSARGYVGVLVDGNAGPANGNIVSGNTMHNASIGVGVAGEPASSARSTTILRNSVFNGRPGIFGLQSAIVVGTAQGTQVSSNVAGQQEDGILVLESAVDTTLLGNNAWGNRNDGFEVLSPSTTITKNRAVDNVAVGIRAVAGVVNGGGNVALGNGTNCIPSSLC